MDAKKRFEWYQKNTMRTCKDMGSDGVNLMHMVAGIFSEDNELQTAMYNKDIVNIAEEIADEFWYLSNYCNYRGYSLYELFINQRDFSMDDVENSVDLYYHSLSKLQDIVKKYMVYDREIDREYEQVLLKKVIFYISNIVDGFSIDILNAIKNNIDKLRIRFPEKFIEVLANNRDIDLERKELEK